MILAQDCRDVVLITGGSGLVGQALQFIIQDEVPESKFGVKKNEDWIFISSKDGDLRNFQETKNIFVKYKPKYVIHLAASVGGLFKNMNMKADMFRDNLLINDNVIHCAYEAKVTKLISCLSTCIFPDKTSYPINEQMIHDGLPHDSNLGYAISKRMIDIQNRYFCFLIFNYIER